MLRQGAYEMTQEKRSHEPEGASPNLIERRREIRYPVEATVTVRRKDGQSFQTRAVDISSSGMRLRLADAPRLALDEEITVEVELPDHPDKAFSAWGVGRVAHMDANNAGIQLFAGEFDPPAAGEPA
jgi:c-di-GMP-binding flagellar brake protein YcgR